MSASGQAGQNPAYRCSETSEAKELRSFVSEASKPPFAKQKYKRSEASKAKAMLAFAFEPRKLHFAKQTLVRRNPQGLLHFLNTAYATMAP